MVKPRSTRILLGALLVLSMLSAQALAQETPSAGDQERARTLFHQGLQHVEHEEMADAVAAFRASLTLVPRVSTALNLAFALQSIGSLQNALSVLHRARDGEFGEASPDVGVEAHIARIEASLGTAFVAVSSSGGGPMGEVHIAVDGDQVRSLDGAGAVSFPIDPGQHVISATATDHEATRATVQVSPAGRVEITLHLQPSDDLRPGTLVVDSLPTAQIDVDGFGSGVGHLELELAPRSYQVRVTGEVGSDESEVEVPPGRRVRIYLEPPQRLVRQNPWLWTAVGIVTAGAAAIAIWRIRQKQRDPVVDPVWGNTEALVSW